jgi:hypothetical protein
MKESSAIVAPGLLRHKPISGSAQRLYRAAAKTLKTDGSLVVGRAVAIGTPGAASSLHVGGSQSVHRTAVAADYTATDNDYYIGVTNTAARRSIKLPSAAGRAGRVYIIKASGPP